jgi:hypothetical protein
MARRDGVRASERKIHAEYCVFGDVAGYDQPKHGNRTTARIQSRLGGTCHNVARGAGGRSAILFKIGRNLFVS